MNTGTASKYRRNTTALRAVAGVLCMGWIVASAATESCLPHEAAVVPASGHPAGHAPLEGAQGLGGSGDECCASAHHAAPKPALAAASSYADPELPAGVDTRYATPRFVQASAAPVAQTEEVARNAHPPFYLLYSRLLIPHFS